MKGLVLLLVLMALCMQGGCVKEQCALWGYDCSVYEAARGRK